MLKPKSELSIIVDEEFPGYTTFNWTLNQRKQAGKILKRDGKVAAISFLRKNFDPSRPKKPLTKIAHCEILKSNCPLTEWDLAKCSYSIQEYIYGLPKDQFDTLSSLTSKKEHLDFFQKSGIEPFSNVQLLNEIFKNAKNTYKGQIERQDNINKKKIEDGIEPKPIFDESGKLLERPGPNLDLFMVQDYVFCLIDPNNKKHQEILKQIGWESYNLNPNDKIPIVVKKDRLSIPKGEPGFVPEKDRSQINPKKGRLRYHGNDKPILALLEIKNDWVVIDLRGLLRTYMWLNKRRFDEIKLEKFEKRENLTPSVLLSYFTCNPIIQISKKQVQFRFKDEFIQKESLNVMSYKKFPEWLKTNTPVILASIDLGVTNEIGVKVSKVDDKLDNDFKPLHLESFTLSSDLKEKLKNLRPKADKIESNFRDEAKKLLSIEEQQMVSSLQNSEEALNRLCLKYNLNKENIDFTQISRNGFEIADEIAKNGGDEANNGKKKKNNFSYYRELTKLPEEIREKINLNEWNLKKNSSDYQKFTKEKNELIRHCVNWALDKNVKIAQGQGLTKNNVVFNIEALKINSGFFDSKAKLKKGWNNLGITENNSWYIKPFKTKIRDLTTNKGILVVESNPAHTSTTCTQCNFCDRGNRKGEKFKCQKCGFEEHDDRYIAPTNLERVALSGKKLPGPERLPDKQNPKVARKRKSLKFKEKLKSSLLSSGSIIEQAEPLANQVSTTSND